MNTAIKSVLFFTLIFCFGFTPEKDNTHDEYLRGTWYSSNSSEFKSFSFMKGNLIRILLKNGEDYGLDMHYSLIKDKTSNSRFKVTLLQKDILRDKYKKRGELNISIKNRDTLIFHSNNKGDIILNRNIPKMESR